MNKSSYAILFSTAALLSAPAFTTHLCPSAQPVKTATITVEQNDLYAHRFDGLGASSINPGKYQEMHPETRSQLCHMLWYDLNFRVLRLWAWVSDKDSAQSFANRYLLFYKESREARAEALADGRARPEDTLLILLGPTGPINDLESYATFYSQLAYYAENDFGMHFDYTGLANEPNYNNQLTADQVPVLVKYFRRALDRFGLQHVKILGPETSNVDNVAFDMTWAVIADEEALDMLDAFSTHSYNMCVVHQYWEMIEPHIHGRNKQYWQTESSENGPEDFNDSIRAVQGLARCISDVNLGVNVWIWFLGMEEFDPVDNATRLMGYNVSTGEFRPFLKYYYFRQFSRTIEAGADMRFCFRTETTPPETTDRDRYMENWYGQKPSICACAGINPDGSWGFTLTNMTGVVSNWAGSYYYERASYDVTFYVPELETEGARTFQVMKCNNGVRNEIIGTTEMEDGRFTVRIDPMDIICVREDFKTGAQPFYEVPDFPPIGDYGPCGMGFGLGFIPPLGFKIKRLIRKKRIL
jgi:hypothetical protein